MPSSFVECENIATLARCDAVRRGHPLHQSDPAKMAPDTVSEFRPSGEMGSTSWAPRLSPCSGVRLATRRRCCEDGLMQRVERPVLGDEARSFAISGPSARWPIPLLELLVNRACISAVARHRLEGGDCHRGEDLRGERAAADGVAPVSATARFRSSANLGAIQLQTHRAWSPAAALPAWRCGRRMPRAEILSSLTPQGHVATAFRLPFNRDHSTACARRPGLWSRSHGRGNCS
jgi:hypothetical protein